MSQPSESTVQIAQQAQVLTEAIESRTADSRQLTVTATPPDDQELQQDLDEIETFLQDGSHPVTPTAALESENEHREDNTQVTMHLRPRLATPDAKFVRHIEREHTHDPDPMFDDEVEDGEPNVDSNDVTPLLRRPKSPEEVDEDGASEHDIPIPQPSEHSQRIVSNAVRVLGLGVETGLQHTTPHLVSGYHMENDLHDIPLPRVPRSTVEQRLRRMHFIPLSEEQSTAHAETLRASDLKCPLTTVYPDASDLFSLMGSNWHKGGPQCWTKAIDLCIMFAEKGNLYNAPSQFQVYMLTNMPRVRHPKLSTQWKRQGEWDFNWERNDNIDSFLAYMCGTMLEKAEWCDGCKKGKGMMVGCVVIEGYMQEACTNHWRNSKQSNCQFYQPKKKEVSRKRLRPSSDDDGDDGEEDQEEVIDLAESVSVTQRSSQQKAPKTPRKKRKATPPHDFSPINRLPRPSSATLLPRKATTASKKAKREATPAPAQKKVKAGKVKSDVTLRSLEQLRQEGLINEDSLAKQIRRAQTFTPKQIDEQRQLHLSAVQEADNDMAQLQSHIDNAEEAMRNARAALQLTLERRLKAEKALALVNSLKEEQQVDMTLGDF